MNNTIEEIFKIDKIGKGIAVKILFAFLVMLRVAVNVFPIGSSDFDNLISFTNKLLEDPAMAQTMELTDIPITTGNLIYLASILMTEFICICGYYVYVGMMIRSMRVGDKDHKPISMINLAGRIIILMAVTCVLFFPMSIILLYLFLFFIIIFPWLFMYPACYLSGDSGFFMSFAEVFKKNKGYYFVNVRNLAVIMMISLFLQMISVIVSKVYEPAYIVVDSFIFVFTMFCIARYSCLIYRRMLMFPVRGKGPVEPLNR